MKIVLVGKRDGKRVVRWRNLLGLSAVLSMLLGSAMGGFYYLLAGQGSHLPVFLGIGMGVALSSFGVLSGLICPLDQLQALK
jgi:hypothetical protein